jgi:transposase
MREVVKSRFKSRRASNEEIMYYVTNVMKGVASWKSLKYGIPIGGIHYQTVYKRFQKWVQSGILKEVWNMIRDDYLMSIHDPMFTQNLYIDTTFVKNIHGMEDVGRNPTDRGRLGSKVSVIVDANRVPLSEPVLFAANVHDSKTVDTTLATLKTSITDRRRVIRLAGDKAYQLTEDRKQRNYNDRRIRMVVEKKSTVQYSSLRRKDVAMFKKRSKIENHFAHIKNIHRLRNRYDARSIMFLSFWYIRVMELIFRQISRENDGDAMV